jgi:hypothetical protein
MKVEIKWEDVDMSEYCIQTVQISFGTIGSLQANKVSLNSKLEAADQI